MITQFSAPISSSFTRFVTFDISHTAYDPDNVVIKDSFQEIICIKR